MVLYKFLGDFDKDLNNDFYLLNFDLCQKNLLEINFLIEVVLFLMFYKYFLK
jgi:hypothetical protein